MDSNSYIWGGAVAGLAVVAALGFLLARHSGAIRGALEPYVGERPARWLLYLAWFAYVYSTLNAVGQVLNVVPMFAPDAELPSAVGFIYGVVWHTLLAFLNALVPIVHTAALIVAAVVLYRHLKRQPA